MENVFTFVLSLVWLFMKRHHVQMVQNSKDILNLKRCRVKSLSRSSSCKVPLPKGTNVNIIRFLCILLEDTYTSKKVYLHERYLTRRITWTIVSL